MFRVKRAAENLVVLWATIILLVAMVAATATTVWLVAEIRKEQRAILEIVKGGVVEDIERLGTLPGEFRLQLVFTILVLLVLIAAAIGLTFVVLAHLKSLKSLREIKILAWDILASMDQGVVTTDHRGKITSMNPRSQELLGIEFDCVGRPLEEICQNAQPLAEASRAVIESGKSQNDCLFSHIQNGHPLQLRVKCHVLHGTDAMGTVLYIHDETEHKFIEERMRRMERFMRLGTLAAGLHHEIKNPLSALSLHVQLLEERLEGQADDETAENLGVLKTEVTRIVGVLESFRDYASNEKINQTPTDITALVRQTVDLIRPKAQQQGIQLVVRVPDVGLPTISSDATRLEQVFLNLVMNALEEMHDSGTLSVSVASDEGRIVIEVSDTGHGIPDNIRSRIYDPYFTTKSNGTGMGLAVCDKIIRQHGGQINVDTGPSGSTFRISLPEERH
jgi:two-component system, NtrC family, sensor histidine kinase HydH